MGTWVRIHPERARGLQLNYSTIECDPCLHYGGTARRLTANGWQTLRLLCPLTSRFWPGRQDHSLGEIKEIRYSVRFAICAAEIAYELGPGQSLRNKVSIRKNPSGKWLKERVCLNPISSQPVYCRHSDVNAMYIFVYSDIFGWFENIKWWFGGDEKHVCARSAWINRRWNRPVWLTLLSCEAAAILIKTRLNLTVSSVCYRKAFWWDLCPCTIAFALS